MFPPSVLPSLTPTRSRPFSSLIRSVSLFLQSPSLLPLRSLRPSTGKFEILDSLTPGCFPLFEIYSQLRRRTPVRYRRHAGVICSSLSRSCNKYIDFVFIHEWMICRTINATLSIGRTIKPPWQIITYRSNKYDYWRAITIYYYFDFKVIII